MSSSLCQCHCGTRIDLDEQLLEQRQIWKQKYQCLQKQIQVDISTLKQNIYAECAALMQKEFCEQQQQHNKIVNSKNTEIKDLVARVIRLESQVKVLAKEKQLVEFDKNKLEKQHQELSLILNQLKSKHSKHLTDTELKFHTQLQLQLKRLLESHSEQTKQLQKQNEHLKHKLKSFQKNYAALLPEVQKLKNALSLKTDELQNLKSHFSKSDNETGKKYKQLLEQNNNKDKTISSLRKQLQKLNDEIHQLNLQVDKLKKNKQEVRVEPVYIDRPIQVEKVVEKIVQVQKIVNRYIEPSSSPMIEKLQAQNHSLNEQLSNLLKQLHQIQHSFEISNADYEQCIKAHENNVEKYKQERDQLVKRIQQQNKELELLQSYLQRARSAENQAQKIIVHVKNDGTYEKMMEKKSNIKQSEIPKQLPSQRSIKKK